MIRAVAFDLWETLITNTPEISQEHRRLRLSRLESILGTHATADRIDAAYRHTWHRCQELYWSVDKDIPCRTQIDHLLEALELPAFDEPTMEILEDAYASVAVEVLPALVEGAKEVVLQLAGRYRLGLISNTGRTPGSALRKILDRLEIAKFFDAMVFSNEHGECKPQRSIFESLRASLGVPFDEVVFVGDNLYVDVHGAQQCGMTAIHFTPSRRGDAVSPIPDHGLTIEPDATISDLSELPEAIEALAGRHPESRPRAERRGDDEGSQAADLEILRRLRGSG